MQIIDSALIRYFNVKGGEVNLGCKSLQI